MNLKAQLSALRNDSRNLTLAERAELSCRLAKQLEKVGDYEAACEAMGEFWPERDEPPKVDDLDEPTRAEILLRVGALAGWQGSASQSTGCQEMAKDLITQSIEIFEALGQSERGAEARADLALCYWREGAFDEARIHLGRALELLKNINSDVKACVLIRAGMVEVDARRLNEALCLYNKATPLLERSEDHALKGAFHNEFARLYRWFGRAENVDRALIEYAAASFHFEQAGNDRYLARVENNLGYLYFTIGQYKDAHNHLDRARHLFLELRDVGTAAQVDETRARTLLAEGYVSEAERLVRSAVRTLERGGQQANLAEALTTHGIALARLGQDPRSKASLERAVEVAETAGDLEGAGRAKLSIIEELGDKLSIKELISIYRSAIDLLRGSQDPSTARRSMLCAAKLLDVVERLEPEQGPPETNWEGFSFKQHVRNGERAVIEQALRDAGGSVSKAARLLGFKHHQSLISLLNTRHKELLKTRSTVRKRRRHLFSPPRKMKKKVSESVPKRPASQITILHVEDNKAVARLVQDTLGAEGMHVDSCLSGTTALEVLRTDAPYDAIIVDNDLPGLSGLELVLRAKSIAHRRNTPILMLSGDDIEKEAWRAGVDEFLRKPQDIERVSSTVERLLAEVKDKID